MTQVFYSQTEAAAALDGAVVAIGNFDGMHIGHQAIFEAARSQADTQGLTMVALTFEPHPSAFFRPDDAPARLSPPSYKFELMQRYGADAVVALTFDESLAGLSPEAFVESVLVDSLKAKHVVVGEDFRFGKQRAGDTESLESLGKPRGMTCEVAEFVTWQGAAVSSTRIRASVEEGDLAQAQQMLGRPFRLFGEVVHGDARGRKLGFPTANMKPVQMAMPPVGVYATSLARAGQPHWRGITNIGRRPTFGGGDVTIETFVLDESVDEELELYGDDVELDLYRRVRGEKRFDSPAELIAQIRRDIEEVSAFFDKEGLYGRR